MDHLWTPWRFAYVTTAETAVRPGVPASLDAWPGDMGCVFCNLIASVDYAISEGKSQEDAEAAGGLILRGNHGDAIRASGPPCRPACRGGS
jgi:ATP adenylyltransferase